MFAGLLLRGTPALKSRQNKGQRRRNFITLISGTDHRFLTEIINDWFPDYLVINVIRVIHILGWR